MIKTEAHKSAKAHLEIAFYHKSDTVVAGSKHVKMHRIIRKHIVPNGLRKASDGKDHSFRVGHGFECDFLKRRKRRHVVTMKKDETFM